MSEPDKEATVIAIEPIVKIDSEVTRCIRQHARMHIKTEVCGVLIGEKVGEAVQIRSSIEALNASQGGTHVTFTQEAWEEIYRVKDERYPEARIVGWYHSHPGFGVFLSEHDLFIQQNFFSAPDQVAWVYDPHTDEEGCFGWVGGAVHRIQSLTIADQNGDGVERTPKSMATVALDDEEESPLKPAHERPSRRGSGWMAWSTLALVSLTMLLAGFAVAYLIFPRPVLVIPYMDPASGKMMLREAPELLPYLLDHKALPIDSDMLHRQDPASPPTPSNSPAASPGTPAGGSSSKPSVPGATPSPASTPAPSERKP